MRNRFLKVVLLALTHAAIFFVGKYAPPLNVNDNEEGESDLIVIVAIKEEKAHSKMDAAYFAEKVFGAERSEPWLRYHREGNFLGYKGCVYSQKSLPQTPAIFLPLFAIR